MKIASATHLSKVQTPLSRAPRSFSVGLSLIFTHSLLLLLSLTHFLSLTHTRFLSLPLSFLLSLSFSLSLFLSFSLSCSHPVSISLSPSLPLTTAGHQYPESPLCTIVNSSTSSTISRDVCHVLLYDQRLVDVYIYTYTYVNEYICHTTTGQCLFSII